MSAEKIIDEATHLPVELQIQIVDALLQSINPDDSELRAEWIEVCNQRLAEVRSGAVEPIPAEDVLAELYELFPPR